MHVNLTFSQTCMFSTPVISVSLSDVCHNVGLAKNETVPIPEPRNPSLEERDHAVRITILQHSTVRGR